MDFPVEGSKGPTNCPFPSKQRQASARKRWVVKQTQKQLQAYRWPIEPVLTTKLPKLLSKLTRLHLMDDNNLDIRVERENIKEISAKESVFRTSSIKLCTVLPILQESDSLVWKKRPTVTNMVQEQRQEIKGQELQQNEPADKNPDTK